MTADEIQADIDRAEAKRRELVDQLPKVRPTAKVLSILPGAGEMYRRQVAFGLEGDPDASLKARIFSRDWFCGHIDLEPLPGNGLVAHWNENAAALLRAATLGTSGSGGASWTSNTPEVVDIELR